MKLLRDLETKLGCARDQTGVGILRHRFKQFHERNRAQKRFAAAAIANRFQPRLRRFEPRIELVRRAALSERVGRGVADRTIAGAAAQISAELLVELRAGLEILAVVALEQHIINPGVQ